MRQEIFSAACVRTYIAIYNHILMAMPRFPSDASFSSIALLVLAFSLSTHLAHCFSFFVADPSRYFHVAFFSSCYTDARSPVLHDITPVHIHAHVSCTLISPAANTVGREPHHYYCSLHSSRQLMVLLYQQCSWNHSNSHPHWTSQQSRLALQQSIVKIVTETVYNTCMYEWPIMVKHVLAQLLTVESPVALANGRSVSLISRQRLLHFVSHPLLAS